MSTKNFDAREAQQLLADTEQSTHRSMDVNSAPLLVAWGLAFAVGFTCIWFDTRGQDPYTGPGWSLAVLGLAMIVALVVTIVTIVRAVRGVVGKSSRLGAFYGISWFAGFIIMYALAIGLSRLDASDEVIGLFMLIAPLLIVSVIYCVSAALWEETGIFVAGVGLAIAAAAGAIAGPVTGALVIAIAGTAAFLIGAAVSKAGSQ